MYLLLWRRVFVVELGLLIGPAMLLLSTTPQKFTFDRRRKIFLVVRRGWQVWINRRSVAEVRERETYGDVASEETTSHNKL